MATLQLLEEEEEEDIEEEEEVRAGEVGGEIAEGVGGGTISRWGNRSTGGCSAVCVSTLYLYSSMLLTNFFVIICKCRE